MKKFLKRNRYTVILVFIFILLVILGIKIKDIFVPDEGKPVYGDRLKCAEKNPLTESSYTKADEELKKNSNVEKVSHRLQGKKIIYFIVLNSKVSVKDARGIGDSIVKDFDEELLTCYSLEVNLEKEDEKENNFPIQGYKHPESKTISWTKDREKTVESEKNED